MLFCFAATLVDKFVVSLCCSPPPSTSSGEIGSSETMVVAVSLPSGLSPFNVSLLPLSSLISSAQVQSLLASNASTSFDSSNLIGTMTLETTSFSALAALNSIINNPANLTQLVKEAGVPCSSNITVGKTFYSCDGGLLHVHCLR